MEERYEIRGKIGQGGLGAVYRGYDTRMNREVAIKRITTAPGDPELQEESTRQLLKEAGALASLQHPHIVTVYDVGADVEGPYVVMELISGKTIDELIERAPLTWPDFRELALQTQEALIAAQELNLIHSDLKPSNLMLTWLPSGKFQIKIVDFGLASLTQTQTKEDAESMEAVFGSVFFMPPEQFERAPLDARSDVYSMGCVYYQALTGIYPFDGKTGNEVMVSHLHHTVKHIKEVRSEIPLWACDWIMWQINRYPQDRPESSREALSVFLKNDRIPNPPMSTGIPQPTLAPPRARLIVPGSGPASKGTTAHQTATPIQGPSKANLVQTAQVATLVKESAASTQTAPQPLAPPEGFKPSVHSSDDPEPQNSPVHPTTKGSHPSASKRLNQPTSPEKKVIKLSKNAKIGIATVGAILVLVLGGFIFKLAQQKSAANKTAELIALAEKDNTTEIPINSATLNNLLNYAAASDSSSELLKMAKLLTLAKATDGTDIDGRITYFATKGPGMPTSTKEMLIGNVLRNRANPSILPVMLEFSSTTNDPKLVVAALQSVRNIAGDEQFDRFLKLLETNDENQVRDAAEANMVEIIKKSKNIDTLVKALKSSQESTSKADIQKALKRLLAFCNTIKPA